MPAAHLTPRAALAVIATLVAASLPVDHAARAATPRPAPSANKPAPKRAPRSATSAPKPTCSVSVPGISGQGPQCTTATSVIASDASGKAHTTTTIAFVPGASTATAVFTAPGMPTASMHTSQEQGFTYEVTLTVGAQRWSAKRTPTEPGPPAAVLRYTSSEGSGASVVSHGYAIVPLAPDTTTGATQAVQMRVDF